MKSFAGKDPVFEHLESRILLSGSPVPEAGESMAVSVDAAQEDSTQVNEAVTEILFIDSGIKDFQQFLAGINRNVEIHIIDSQVDGVDFITDILSDRENVSAIHILSHGNDGEIHLGNKTYSSDNLSQYQQSLESWGRSLTGDADILIYGCDVGTDNLFIQQIADYTGADVAASNNATGAVIFGGDADLEISTGQIESTVLFDQADYNESNIKLAELNFDSDYKGSNASFYADLAAAFNDAADGDTIVFSSDITIDFTSQISTNKAVNIRVDNGADVVFDGQNLTRLLHYNLNGRTDLSTDNSLYEVTIDGVKLQNGNTVNSWQKVEVVAGVMTTSTVTAYDPVNDEWDGDSDAGLYFARTIKAVYNSDGGDNGAGGALHAFGLNLTLKNVEVTGSNSFRYGGGVYHKYGNITVENSTFTDNRASRSHATAAVTSLGGAIYTDSRNGGTNSNWDVIQTFTGNTLEDNVVTAAVEAATNDRDANSYGGAIYALSYSVGANTVSFTDNTISDNIAESLNNSRRSRAYGGAVYADTKGDSTGNFQGNEISGNSINAENTLNSNNYGYAYGGGIYTSQFETLNFIDNEISSNTVKSNSNGHDSLSYGGGIYNNSPVDSTILFRQNEITGNTLNADSATRYSRAYGGGIFNNGTDNTVTYDENTVTGNAITATGQVGTNHIYSYGGGIYNTNSQSAAYTDNTVNMNTATSNSTSAANTNSYSYGGGIYNTVRPDQSAVFTGNEISGNEAKSTHTLRYTYSYGGGVYTTGTGAGQTFTDNTIEDNKATGEGTGADSRSYSYGAGIYVTNADAATYTDNKVNNNSASSTALKHSYSYGGGIYTSLRPDVSAAYTGNTLTGNSALTSAGANDSFAYGGAIFSTGTRAALTFTSNTVASNTADSKDTGTARSYSYGGGIYTANAVDIKYDRNTVSTNTASSQSSTLQSYSYGGGLSNRLTNDATIVYSSNTINSNTASSNSGDNNSYTYGGGVYTTGTRADVTYTGNTLSANTADSTGDGNNVRSYGGAVYSSNPNAFIFTSNTVANNTASSTGTQLDAYSYGGAVYHTTPAGQTATVSSNTFTSNTASSDSTVRNSYTYGGALYLSGGSGSTVSLTSNTATSNKFVADGDTASTTSAGFGGSFYINSSGTLNVNGNTITGSVNTVNSDSRDATGYGGGLYVNSGANGQVNFSDNRVQNNSISSTALRDSRAYGGGLYLKGSSTSLISLDNETFSSNTITATGDRNSYSYGGGIYTDLYSIGITSSTFSSNSASSTSSTNDAYSYGGGIYNYARANGSAELTDSILSNNSTSSSTEGRNSRSYGGGAYLYANGANINSTVSGNVINGNSSSASIGGANTADSIVAGGGIYLYNNGSETGLSFTGNTVNSNTAGASTASSSNSSDASIYGSGVYVYLNGSKSTPDVIEDNEITNSSSSASTTANGWSRIYGGGLYVSTGGSSTRDIQVKDNAVTTSTNSTVSLVNRGRIYGGVFYSNGNTNSVLTVVNNTFSDSSNTAVSNNGRIYGGGVYISGAGTTSSLYYNTIVNNESSSSQTDGDGLFNSGANLLLWGNIVNFNGGDGNQFYDNANIAETGGNNLIGISFRYTALSDDLDATLVTDIEEVLKPSVKAGDGVTPLYYSPAVNSLLIDAAAAPPLAPAGIDFTIDQIGNSFLGFSRDIGSVEFIPLPVVVVTQPVNGFVIPLSSTPFNPGTFTVNGVGNSQFSSVNRFQGNSLRFLSAGSSLQFDQEFLGSDPLNVVGGIFDASTELESEVADTGNVEQEVEDKEVYDKPQLPQEDLEFIENLKDEEETDEELSFESSEQSLMEITSAGEIDIPVLAQKDLDNRVNLEDTLVGEFDCFKSAAD